MINQLHTPLYESVLAKFEIASLREQPLPLDGLRQQAFEIFKQLGFPTIKNEEWKQTNVLPFLKDAYEWGEPGQQSLDPIAFSKVAALIAAYSEELQLSLKGESKGAYRLVTVNGKINSDLSILPDEGQLKLSPLNALGQDAQVQRYLGKIATIKEDAFAALNTAMFDDGVYLEVGKGTIVDRPLHIINVLLNDAPVFMQPRQLFVLLPHSSIDIIQTSLVGNLEHPVFINGVTEIALQQGAVCNHYEIQTGTQGLRSLHRVEAAQEKHSNYSNYTFTMPGSDIVRNNLSIHLNDAELESHMYGLYMAAEKQLIDNHTEVHHKKPHGQSNQLYKGVMLDHAKAVFNGKIYVYEDAQKTNAFQQSNNILLSKHATVNAKPQLEIFADDVKCSHGTTIGQMDEEALFYLQSRGIGKAQAMNIMVGAFAFDVAQKIKIPALRTYLERLIRLALENRFE